MNPSDMTALLDELALAVGPAHVLTGDAIPPQHCTDWFNAHTHQPLALVRPGTPDEVAGAVNFLMSAEASYITRQVLAVNGGLC